MELIVMILLGVCVFMFCVYFTRWVFGIDQIINLQKDILKELKSINSKNESFEDLDDDGKLSDGDNQVIGNAYPDFTFSIQNSFSYKNFDLSFLFRGSVGNDVLNMSRLYYEGFSYFGSNNILKSTLDHPEYKGGAIYSSRFIEDGSFVKLDNLTLGYNVPLKGKVISKMRIYVTGQNLLTLTKYKGMDPEVHLAGLEPGIEWYTFYPRTKTYLLGLNITF